MNFSENEGLEPITIEKIKILGAVLELPAKQQCRFGHEFETCYLNTVNINRKDLIPL